MRRPRWYDYDLNLQMIRQPSQEPDMAHLRFLRWLVATRPLLLADGFIAGPPAGEYASPERQDG